MGIKKMIAKAGTKAADGIAKLSVLSPEQLAEIDRKRLEYLLEMPDPGDEAAEEVTARIMAASGVEIYNAYLPQIKDLYVPVGKYAEYADRSFDRARNIRYFRITKWVTDRKENSLEKLVNVYQVLSGESCNIALVFNRTRAGTNVYLGISNILNADTNTAADDLEKRLEAALQGNFPGTEVSTPTGTGTVPCLAKLDRCTVACVSNVPAEKSEKFVSQTIEKLLDGMSPDTRSEEYTLILLATPVQDVEERKLRLSEFYTALAPYASWTSQFTFTQSDSTNSTATFGVNAGVSAGVQNGQSVTRSSQQAQANSQSRTESDQKSSTNTKMQNETRNKAQAQTDSDTDSRGESETRGETESTSKGYTKTHSNTHSQQHSKGGSESKGVSTNHSESHMQSKGSGTNISAGIEAGADIGPVKAGVNLNGGKSWTSSVQDGVNDGISESLNNTQSYNDATINSASDAFADSQVKTVAENTAKAITRNIAHGVAKTVTEGVASSTGSSVAETVGHQVANTLGRTLTRSVGTAVGASKSVSLGGNFGANFSRSSNVTATVGKSQSMTQSYINHSIKHTLELLDEQMKRIDESAALGMWDFAAYVLSEDYYVANNVANTYLALTQGEKSYISQAAVNTWRGDITEEKEEARELCDYLKDFRHPMFGLRPDVVEIDPTFQVYPTIVTATTSLSGKELAYSLNFPKKSVAGFPVLACTEFGRNIVTYDPEDTAGPSLRLGSVYHMRREEDTEIRLSQNSLASHTFISGSTGAGKSNTIYQLLNRAGENGVRFLVVEPAKGEYKHMFGMAEDVSVYGTNPVMSPLLRLNPFSFPAGIHVLEHLDRLTEIFNVCWPMYAAMPAVLKQAIEQSYRDCGWDLNRSENPWGRELYPSFADVARNIRTIIDSSEYDAENKGAYKGSLLTRLQSLTNGLCGMIFTEAELTEEQLFEENVIVDLSRVGSSETKSLLMGILVLKLQEYRLSAGDMNVPLRHLTVLEEAHNLLKRSSGDFSAESGNLTGKSVEMISNAIAEMRTYGEGFIIADQAPGLLDMAAIRNTNTKIILRLPDQSDRELVGYAAGLYEDQITELAKLPCGVAVVYQNEWVQPVLCKVDRFEDGCGRYTYTALPEPEPTVSEARFRVAELLSRGMALDRETILGDIKPILDRARIPASIQVTAMKMLKKPLPQPRMTKLAPVMAVLFPEVEEAVREAYYESRDAAEWTQNAEAALRELHESAISDQVRRDIVQGVMTQYLLLELRNAQALQEWHQKGGLK